MTSKNICPKGIDRLLYIKTNVLGTTFEIPYDPIIYSLGDYHTFIRYNTWLYFFVFLLEGI